MMVMANSKAKKLRLKIEREGRMNPEQKRFRNVGLTTRVKRNKTKYTRKGRSASDFKSQCGDGLFYLPEHI